MNNDLNVIQAQLNNLKDLLESELITEEDYHTHCFKLYEKIPCFLQSQTSKILPCRYSRSPWLDKVTCSGDKESFNSRCCQDII